MTLVIGHKGAAALTPENRVTGFELARDLGADGVELDVRRANEQRLAVWHDPALPDGRTLLGTAWTELDGEVDDLTTVLDATAGLRIVNIEIKNWPAEPDYDASLGIAEDVAHELATRPAPERERLLVSCFDLPTLARARDRLDAMAPDITTGILLWTVKDPADTVARAVDGGHAALHPHHSMVTPELVRLAHAAELTVNCWTCNEPGRIRWLASLGVDGIITDDPRAALAALDLGAHARE